MESRPMNIPSLTLDEVLGDKMSWSPTFEAIELLSEMEVIFGRDISTQDVFLVYGRQRLRVLAHEDSDSELDVLIVDLDRNSDQLDRLLSLVQLAKQGYDYVEAE